MALMGAMVTGGLNLLGGLFGAGSQKRAANQQMQLQDRLNENDARRQLGLLQSQNYETWRTNQDIKEYNRDVLDNHSENTLDRREHSITNSTGSIDFKRLVADAEAAGFNPVTVLRAGGLAGYSTQNTQFYSDISERSKVARDIMTYLAPPDVPHMGYNGQVQTINPGNPIGDAINAGMNYFMNYDPTKQQRRELEMGLTRAQIENLNSETRRNMLMQVPSYTGGNRGTSGGFSGIVNSIFGGGTPGTPQATPHDKVGDRIVTNPYPVGSGLEPNKTFIDASAWQERLGEGELAETLVFLLNAGADASHNLSRLAGAPPVLRPAGDAGKNVGSWLSSQYNTLLDSWNKSSSIADFANQNLLQRNNKTDNFPFRFETTR